MKTQIGTRTLYSEAFGDRKDIVQWDVLKIKNGQALRIEFLNSNSAFTQGIRVAVDAGKGYILVNGHKRKGIFLMQDTAPKIVMITCFADMGLLSIYNVWNRGGDIESLRYMSGMVIEGSGIN